MTLEQAIDDIVTTVTVDPHLEQKIGNTYEMRGGPEARALFTKSEDAVDHWHARMTALIGKASALRWLDEPILEKLQMTASDARQTQRLTVGRYCVSTKFILEDIAPVADGKS